MGKEIERVKERRGEERREEKRREEKRREEKRREEKRREELQGVTRRKRTATDLLVLTRLFGT